MSKKVNIVEEDIPEPVEETRDEIVEQVNIPPEPTPTVCLPATKQKVSNLFQCPACGKYLTKKSLNYSHKRTCPALPENQNKPKPQPQPVKEEIKEEVKPELKEEPDYEQPNYYFEPPQIPYHERMRLEKRHLHAQRIRLLTQFIA